MSESPLVLVSGLSGFIAAHCLEQLLQKGYRVRGTVRSQAKADYIKKQYPSADLEIAIVPDIAKENCFDEAIKGVTYFLHTASPFHFNAKDIKKDLIDPALIGTKSALTAADKEKSVKKVVITSSFAAILNASKGNYPNHTYSEEDWNPITMEEAVSGNAQLGYRGSKTFAEKLGWDFVEKEKRHFLVAFVNPPLVFGKILNQQQLESINTSNVMVRDYLHGKKKECTNEDARPWVDVTDVAAAHIAAMLRPDQARYFCTNGLFTSQQLCNVLRKNFPELKDKIPEGNPSNWQPKPESEMFRTDNSKSRKELGLNYMDFETSIVGTAKSILSLEK